MYYTCQNGRLTANICKRVFSNPNPKVQKRFWKNEMTSFFRQVSRYREGGLAFKSRNFQIWHTVANSSPPLSHLPKN